MSLNLERASIVWMVCNAGTNISLQRQNKDKMWRGRALKLRRLINKLMKPAQIFFELYSEERTEFWFYILFECSSCWASYTEVGLSESRSSWTCPSEARSLHTVGNLDGNWFKVTAGGRLSLDTEVLNIILLCLNWEFDPSTILNSCWIANKLNCQKKKASVQRI